MNQNIPSSLERFGEELDRAASRHFSGAPAPMRTRSRLSRPRYLAGGSLGVAGVAAAATLALSGGAAAPAFAVTPQSNGSVLVTINQMESVPQANAKLAAMGDHEVVAIRFVQGAATTEGPVSCSVGSGVTGPPVRVLLGSDGTQVIAAGNTGAGTWHVAGCLTGTPGSDPDPSGTPLVATPVPAGHAAQLKPGSRQLSVAPAGTGRAATPSGNSGS